MSTAGTLDPIAAIRAEARRAHELPVPVRMWRSLMTLWLQHCDRRVAQSVYTLDHPEVLEDFRRARRG